eukprot:COSAG01_NODE_3670_length_5810_cov_30.694099_4_plen_193_part_00
MAVSHCFYIVTAHSLLCSTQSRSLARMAAARAGIRRTSPPPLLWQRSIGSCYHFRNRRSSPQPPPAQPDSDQACCRSWALCLPHHHRSSPRASPCRLYHSGTSAYRLQRQRVPTHAREAVPVAIPHARGAVVTRAVAVVGVPRAGGAVGEVGQGGVRLVALHVEPVNAHAIGRHHHAWWIRTQVSREKDWRL